MTQFKTIENNMNQNFDKNKDKNNLFCSNSLIFEIQLKRINALKCFFLNNLNYIISQILCKNFQFEFKNKMYLLFGLTLTSIF